MNNFKGDYLEDAEEKYGVFISDLKYTELRTQVLLELTVEAEKYSREALTEAVSYLEGKNVKFKDLKEMKNQIFRFLGVGKDNLVVGTLDCGDLVEDEENRKYLILCEPGTHPVGTTVETLEHAVYLGEDEDDL